MDAIAESLRLLQINARRGAEALRRYNNRRVVFVSPHGLSDELLFESFEELNEVFKRLKNCAYQKASLEAAYRRQYDALEDEQRTEASTLRDAAHRQHGIDDVERAAAAEAALHHCLEVLPEFRRAASERLALYDKDMGHEEDATVHRSEQSPFSTRAQSRDALRTATPGPEEPPAAVTRPPLVPTAVCAPPTNWLPPMQLPTFAGDPARWPAFWDAFEATIDRRELEGCLKLAYLRGALKGDAQLALATLGSKNEDYQTALSTLRALFANPVLVSSRLRNEIIGYQLREHSTKSLFRAWAQINILHEQLMAVSPEQDCETLGQLISEKFPRHVMQ